ncbi:hypothetical protein WME99_30595 [Sorangium sp. So ce136]|uniref:hypothetical protein n=1 Tax=Sorangium sp. So ce136 TaxID=3133284 RepID=UPI003F067770
MEALIASFLEPSDLPALALVSSRGLAAARSAKDFLDSHPGLWYGAPWKFHPYAGQQSTRVPGTMAGWWFDVVPASRGCYTFCHTTTQADKINGSAIIIGEGQKEFGPGFYTTCGDSLAPCKIIGAEWFTKKQKDPKWKVIRFDVPGAILRIAPRDLALKTFLHHVLTHSTGYLHGGDAPAKQDIDAINAINKLGKVLIFPDDKDAEVAYGKDGDVTSWTRYTKSKLGGGGYALVIGPQQPVYMGNIRQYAWTFGPGLWMINCATRYLIFENR